MQNKLAHVLLLDGNANTVSVARSLGKRGIHISFAPLNSNIPATSKYIKHKYQSPPNVSFDDFLYELLLKKTEVPEGTVIFPCSDAAITFIANHKEELSTRYILDIQKKEQQLQLLDKEETLELAKMVGCAFPNHWNINKESDIQDILPTINYPVLIKPIVSHIFQKRFGKKLFFIENESELLEKSKIVFLADIEFFICEFIPGPDSLLSSYYVYINNDRQRLFEYTKRVFRRAPKNFGGGTYHQSKWLPETAALGYKFFNGIDFTGLGNIEFKYDQRDKQLKIIECNARFTAAQELVTRSGIDMPSIIYDYLCYGKFPNKTSFRDNVTLLLPFDDIDAFRDLRKRKEITLLGWLKSIIKPQVFCYMSLTDPGPFLYATYLEIKNRTAYFINRFKP